jgi:hypothetical protein
MSALETLAEAVPRGVDPRSYVSSMPLQVDGPDTWGFECYAGGDMYSCMIGDMVGAFSGSVTFGLIFGGFIILAYYLAGDGEIATVAIVTILFGGILIPALPGTYRTVAYSIMFAGMFVGLWAVTRRYVLEVGT